MWSWRDFWLTPDPHPYYSHLTDSSIDQDINVVLTKDKACVIIATMGEVTKTVYRLRKLYYTWKKRRFRKGWKIKYDGQKIHNMLEGEPLIAEVRK